MPSPRTRYNSAEIKQRKRTKGFIVRSRGARVADIVVIVIINHSWSVTERVDFDRRAWNQFDCFLSVQVRASLLNDQAWYHCVDLNWCTIVSWLKHYLFTQRWSEYEIQLRGFHRTQTSTYCQQLHHHYDSDQHRAWSFLCQGCWAATFYSSGRDIDSFGTKWQKQAYTAEVLTIYTTVPWNYLSIAIHREDNHL